MSEPTLVEAQREAALDALADMVRLVSAVGGYMTHEQLQTLWIAQAVLEEAGREWR